MPDETVAAIAEFVDGLDPDRRGAVRRPGRHGPRPRLRRRDPRDVPGLDAGRPAAPDGRGRRAAGGPLARRLPRRSSRSGAPHSSASTTTAEIKRVYVAPEARGRGVARALLARLEEIARDVGYTTLRLDTGATPARVGGAVRARSDTSRSPTTTATRWRRTGSRSGSHDRRRPSIASRSGSPASATSDAIAPLLGQLGYPASALELGERLERLTDHPDGEVLVAELDGEVVGSPPTS